MHLLFGAGLGVAVGSHFGFGKSERGRQPLAGSGWNPVLTGMPISASNPHTAAATTPPQPFPPGFEGLDFEQICRRGPAAARFVALLAWADRVPREGVADAVKAIGGRASDEWAVESRLALSMLMARWGELDPAYARQVLEADRIAKRLGYWGWPALLASMARSDPALARQTFEDKPLLFAKPGMAGLLTEFGIALAANDPRPPWTGRKACLESSASRHWPA